MGEDGVGCYGFIVTPNVVCWVWGLDGLLDIVSRHDIGCIAGSDLECLAYDLGIGMEEIGSVLLEIHWLWFHLSWFSEAIFCCVPRL